MAELAPKSELQPLQKINVILSRTWGMEKMLYIIQGLAMMCEEGLGTEVTRVEFGSSVLLMMTVRVSQIGIIAETISHHFDVSRQIWKSLWPITGRY